MKVCQPCRWSLGTIRHGIGRPKTADDAMSLKDIDLTKDVLRRTHGQLSRSFRLHGRPCFPDTQPYIQARLRFGASHSLYGQSSWVPSAVRLLINPASKLRSVMRSMPCMATVHRSRTDCCVNMYQDCENCRPRGCGYRVLKTGVPTPLRPGENRVCGGGCLPRNQGQGRLSSASTDPSVSESAVAKCVAMRFCSRSSAIWSAHATAARNVSRR